MIAIRPSVAAGERGEARQDLTLSKLLLCAADDQQVTWAGGARAGGLGHVAGQHSECEAATSNARLDRMSTDSLADDVRIERRDYYAVLGAEPSASVAELRAAFREAVLRHHPDRSADDSLATRRTSVLNRAWGELRDPVRRLHYDNDLERGRAATLTWPLEPDEAAAPTRRPRLAARPVRTRWHTPEWRSVQGFRVPTQVFMAGPAAQRAWIVANQIDGEDWREHRERYWLRFAAAHYRDRGRIDDWLGAVERLVELDGTYETLVGADLRHAYVTSHEYLRGTGFLRTVGLRYAAGSAQRRWVDRELRALLVEYRDARVRRGRPEDRAEAAELLLNYLEALEMPPAFADVRAAIMAHLRAGHAERRRGAAGACRGDPDHRACPLVQHRAAADRGRAAGASIGDAGGHRAWRSPRGPRSSPAARGPARRIAAARVRLARARERAAVSTAKLAASSA